LFVVGVIFLSTFGGESVSPSRRNPDANDLDRLAASLHHLMSYRRETSVIEESDHMVSHP
jgi:hypothetical protein